MKIEGFFHNGALTHPVGSWTGQHLVKMFCRLRQPAATLLLGLSVGLVAVACSSLPTDLSDQITGEQRKQASNYARQGNDNMATRNWSQAETFYRQSLEVNQSVDNLEGVAEAHNSLGFLYLGLGRPDDAEKEYLDAAEAAHMSGSGRLEVAGLVNLAKIKLYRSAWNDALTLLDKAQTHSATVKLRPVEVLPFDQIKAQIQHSRGMALKELGRNADARLALSASLEINKRIKAAREEASDRYLLASLDNKDGKTAEAIAGLRIALELDKAAENSEGISADLRGLAVLLSKEGADSASMNEAWDFLKRSFRVSLAINDADAASHELVMLQELAGRLGLTDQQSYYAGMYKKLQDSLKPKDAK